jgi:hypothetical protein
MGKHDKVGLFSPYETENSSKFYLLNNQEDNLESVKADPSGSTGTDIPPAKQPHSVAFAVLS